MSFIIDMSTTTDVLSRFYRQSIRNEPLPHWSDVDMSKFSSETVESARRQWVGRATAAYYAMLYSSELINHCANIGLPMEMIGGATRILQEQCRHVEVCARLADILGGREDRQLQAGKLTIMQEDDDPIVLIYEAMLAIYGFNSSFSGPIFDAISTITSEDAIAKVGRTLVLDFENHAKFSWEALAWLSSRLDSDQRGILQDRLPQWIAHFERVCCAGRDMLEELAGSEIVVEQAGPNMGTLTDVHYAAIYYHTLTNEIFPALQSLGFDAETAWNRHYHYEARRKLPLGLGIVGADAIARGI